MPYTRCASCGLTTFVVRSHAWAPVCPRCEKVLADASAVDDVDTTLRLVRQLLEMDVAMVTEVTEGQEVARHAVGEWPGVESLVGGAVPLEETFCKRMLEGEIENFVSDVAADDRVRDLGLARALGVGAWIGVALPPSLGRLYVLCCLAREARQFGDIDVHVLSGFAATLGWRLDDDSR